jgi:hypothetical protein
MKVVLLLGLSSQFTRGFMVITIRKGHGKLFNQPTKGHKLDKEGKIWKNNLLDTDFTSQIPTRRKLK